MCKTSTKKQFYCTIQGEAEWVLAAALISFLYLNNKLLKFCVFEQLFESLDVLMMNIDMWAVD